MHLSASEAKPLRRNFQFPVFLFIESVRFFYNLEKLPPVSRSFPRTSTRYTSRTGYYRTYFRTEITSCSVFLDLVRYHGFLDWNVWVLHLWGDSFHWWVLSIESWPLNPTLETKSDKYIATSDYLMLGDLTYPRKLGRLEFQCSIENCSKVCIHEIVYVIWRTAYSWC